MAEGKAHWGKWPVSTHPGSAGCARRSEPMRIKEGVKRVTKIGRSFSDHKSRKKKKKKGEPKQKSLAESQTAPQISEGNH